MKEGDFVKVVHCKRSKYMNSEFLKWVDEHKDIKYYVLSVVNNGVRLSKVGFLITTEFLEVV